MAVKKITDLTQLTDLDATDSFVVNDSSAGADKRVEFSDLQSEVLNGASIGTGTAITELQVDNLNLNGNTISSTDTNGNVLIQPNGTGDVVINESGADVDFRVEGDTDQNLLFVDASTDRIGVGTNAPTATLTLESSTDASIDINGTSLTTQDVFIRLESPDTGVAYIGIDDSESLLKFNNTSSLSSANHLVIDTSGNVGIGGASSGHKLEVNGNLSLVGSNPFIYLNGSAINQKATFRNQNGPTASIDINSPTITFTDDTTERMRIDSSGNVTMKNGLVVNEDQGNFDFRVEGDTDSHLIFADASADRVGISTSTPQTTFHVDGITCVNDNYFILSANASTAQSNTHTITIPFTSSAQYGAFIVEVIYASTWSDNNPTFSGRATYALTTAATIYDITELEDIGADVSFAATNSGLNFIITATSTASAGQEPNRIGAVVRITRGNNAVSNRPTGITLT